MSIREAVGANLLLLLVACPAFGWEVTRSFEQDVRPILKKHCHSCHGNRERESGLDARTRDQLILGGESGPAIVPFSAARSRLVELVKGGDMPPEKPRLSETEIATLVEWVDGGALLNGESVDEARQHFASLAVSEADVMINVFFTNCVHCHGKWKQEGGLDLRTRAGLLEGGKSGPALIPGDPEASLVLQRIVADEMPPKKNLFGDEQYTSRVRVDDIEKLRSWIAAGAPAAPTARHDPPEFKERRAHWAFSVPKRPRVPPVKRVDLVNNPIDVFLLAQLEQRGLSFNEEASAEDLLRRVTFALTGLPPQPEDVQRYLERPTELSYEALVERLLSSPHFGERLANEWLDAAGYADTHGQINRDELRPFMWRYRDYVIRALNLDKPYDQFLGEQIAGDEQFDFRSADRLSESQVASLVATGFLRTASDATDEGSFNKIPNRFAVINEQIDILTTAVLGLTLECARCHTHKFDPISHRDYYRFAAIFRSALDPYDWRIPNVVLFPPQYEVPPKYSRDLRLGSDTVRGPAALFNRRIERKIAFIARRERSTRWAAARAFLQRRLQTPPRLLAHYRFEGSEDSRVVRNEVTGLAEGTNTAHHAVDCPQVDGLENRSSLDLSWGGSAEFKDPFVFHAGPNQDATIEFYLKPVGPTGQYGSVFWTNEGSAGDRNRFNFDLRVQAAKADLGGDYRGKDGEGPFGISRAARGVDLHKWTHVAIVRYALGGGRYRYFWYYDGVLNPDQSQVASGPLPDASSWSIGGRPGFPCHILLDELRVWDGGLWPEAFLCNTGRAALPEVDVLRRLTRAVEKRPEDWTPAESELHQQYVALLTLPEGIEESTEIRNEIQALRDQLIREMRIHGLTDTGGEPSPVHVLLRGEPRQPGSVVSPGVPSAFDRLARVKPYRVVPPHANTSGRRRALAEWLTQPNHPLTARVLVNRIWQHHFGRGLVETAGNFGRAGSLPSHPALLDWLATEFVASGWSTKHIHRLIVNSAAFRQMSQIPDRALEQDPDNLLLSRFPLRRLDAEAIRDAILSVSGQLDLSPYGPADEIVVTAEGEVSTTGTRRSIYLVRRRKTPVTMLELFDAPAMVPNCLGRRVSTVPTQAMQLFNSQLVRAASKEFAERLVEEWGEDDQLIVPAAYRAAYGRNPTDAERDESRQAIREITALFDGAEGRLRAIETWCHVLLNSPEFVYVD